MKSPIKVVLLTACVLCAQTPNLTGVWKLNVEKSKLAGPPPNGYLMVIDQQADTFKETVGFTSPRGEQRSMLNYRTGEKPAMSSYRGLPMQTVASMNGSTMVFTSKIADTKPGSLTESYSLSPDGNTLTLESVSTVNGKETQQTMVFDKQPDSAGEGLRKPEKTAGETHKNLLILKDMPDSQLINTMRYFNMALGVECGHCHVQGNFAADDKPTKLMARKMLTMTQNINTSTFNGRMEVRCYTCHKGQADPASHPAFN